MNLLHTLHFARVAEGRCAGSSHVYKVALVSAFLRKLDEWEGLRDVHRSD